MALSFALVWLLLSILNHCILRSVCVYQAPSLINRGRKELDGHAAFQIGALNLKIL